VSDVDGIDASGKYGFFLTSTVDPGGWEFPMQNGVVM
jgi:hypothetical protein